MHGLGGFNHWDILIYKVIVGLPPIYLYTYIHQNVWEVLGPKSYSFYLFQRFAIIYALYTPYICVVLLHCFLLLKYVKAYSTNLLKILNHWHQYVSKCV